MQLFLFPPNDHFYLKKYFKKKTLIKKSKFKDNDAFVFLLV